MLGVEKMQDKVITKEKQIFDKLFDKMNKELEDYCTKLLTKPPKEILAGAYKKIAMENILDFFGYETDFSYEDMKKLNKLKKPLEKLYQASEDLGLSHAQDLIDEATFDYKETGAQER